MTHAHSSSLVTVEFRCIFRLGNRSLPGKHFCQSLDRVARNLLAKGAPEFTILHWCVFGVRVQRSAWCPLGLRIAFAPPLSATDTVSSRSEALDSNMGLVELMFARPRLKLSACLWAAANIHVQILEHNGLHSLVHKQQGTSKNFVQSVGTTVTFAKYVNVICRVVRAQKRGPPRKSARLHTTVFSSFWKILILLWFAVFRAQSATFRGASSACGANRNGGVQRKTPLLIPRVSNLKNNRSFFGHIFVFLSKATRQTSVARGSV